MSFLHYWQLDVFADRPLAGNGLAVFADARGLADATLQALTQELRQFESIFLFPSAELDTYAARIFTPEEELPFAGHPLLGAAALLHHIHQRGEQEHWTLQLATRDVNLTTRRHGQGFIAQMNQGQAQFGAVLDAEERRWFAEAFSLNAGDLADYPAQVISTGLPYVLLPVRSEALGRIRQCAEFTAQLAERLTALGAAFVFLLDVDNREGRTWDNAGLVEDVATGSAAGPVAAYLVELGKARRGETFELHQGRFAGRPSLLEVRVGDDDQVQVGGKVQLLAHAQLLCALA
ncbi:MULTISPECIES: PhzF family phenazine biosynthesis protein [unclassified Pseudomonas]|uniref:PhzF family phenazine biosynthesis protein n=1 Tax=unclassified Pseudomonas TaxID=196821 RepID=UPI0002A359CA|nr:MULTISPECIES: PhzF family phenazine biosynthesis protein [unclassified Pseudomonas]MBB1605885.1 phenazine biosynthesis protein PhzF like protein [Pseudomonas sp. UMC76]MBB1639068.1 phenazine biosynthesis protein PhzF like protein [Pseudomonas sp. UME83]NTX89017.1 PhzF family phenazine biosynthesis protein [Pseudomonas sp. UMA643]NTY17705.1 PhzF family phenazine biosynthesis protein [Pseudomonas sp. UMC3103]NTY25065.1 PhzF family phenazine biosynthesis protein [Pseudomonas sp. UMA603]